MGGGEKLPENFAGIHAAPGRPRAIRVLVTGFGAYPKFPDGHWSEDDNASHLITKLLPAQLPAQSRFNHSAHNIDILNPTQAAGAAVRVEYQHVRDYAKILWGTMDENALDLVLHLGMADGFDFYAIERGAWKEGTHQQNPSGGSGIENYTLPDNIGKTINDLNPLTGWGPSMPEKLFAGPGMDVDAVVEAVSNRLATFPEKPGDTKTECKAHPDAGPYLCGFIYYESLARATVDGHRTKAVFSHVPSWKDPESLDRGRDFVCTLIGCLVEYLLDTGLTPR